MTQSNPPLPMNTTNESVQHIAFSISGMHCANCVGRVEHALLHVNGVRRASINLTHERADIDYDSTITAPLQLLQAVQQAGYKAQPWQGIGGQMRRERLARMRVILCLLLTMPLLFGMITHWLNWPWLHGLNALISPMLMLVLASIVQFWGGWPFYAGAVRAISRRQLNMDVLVAIGSTIAYGISVWRLFYDPTAMLAFDSSAMMITFVLLGRWLEARMRRKTMAAVHHLVALQPAHVRRQERDGSEAMVPLAEISIGDVVVVWMGERVPLDGDAVDGLGTFDYGLLTGESAPRILGKGESVLAGALCLNGGIKFTVTSHAGQTMLDRMADMVAVAQASRPELQRLADKVAGYFIAIVLAFALLTFIFWASQNDMVTAQNAALAVLLMACPCALGLAVPVAMSVAIGQAAKHGILLRDAAALERAAQIATVIFDKTGTLSMGEPELAETVAFGAAGASTTMSSEQILSAAAALNQKVNHPVAKALRRIVADRLLPLDMPTVIGNPTIVYGRGVEGTLADGQTLICGNLFYMSEHKVPLHDAAATAAGWEERGRILSWLAVLKPMPRLLGLMSFRDYLRPEAQAALQQLSQHNYQLSILSGDNRHMTLSVAKRLGIGNMIGEAMPQDKLQEIQKRQKWGEVVAMVGDGMNDAPALAMADLGIVMQGGVDAASAAAPVRLLRDDLRLVPAVFDLAKTTRRVMMMSLGWAVIFNVVGLPLAAAGFIPPALSALSMSVSSIVVIINALTLKRWQPDA